MNPQESRKEAIGKLPDLAGVYALCDLDEVPVYVGQAACSKDASIRKRVQRHLTSARSDIIANRQLDVWEIAYVWSWPIHDTDERRRAEAMLYRQFDAESRLVNGKIPTESQMPLDELPSRTCEQIMPEGVIRARQDPAVRFPRQAQQFCQLLDYILNTHDKPHLRVALQVHFDRMNRYMDEFLKTSDGPR